MMGYLPSGFHVVGDPGGGLAHDYEVRTSLNPTAVNEGDDVEDFQENSRSILTQESYTTAQPLLTQYQAQGQRDSLYMGTLSSALPDMILQDYSSAANQRYLRGPSAPPQVMFHMSDMHHALSLPTVSLPPAPRLLYNTAYGNQYQGILMPEQTSFSNPQAVFEIGNQLYHGQGCIGQAYQQPFLLQTGQYLFPNQTFISDNHVVGPCSMGELSGNQPRDIDSHTGFYSSPLGRYNMAGVAPENTRPSSVRGPPRKPCQSGHAIWIGNLPPHADLMSLVLHVFKETSGLKSLFLISKSNCAFANFKDEETCSAAQQSIHESRFQNVRLVSRLRRSPTNTNHGPKFQTGPSGSTTPENQAGDLKTSPESKTGADEAIRKIEFDRAHQKLGKFLPEDKFFVVKSLTVEDLNLSVRNGVWATQPHNEKILNKAFKTSDNVFLIFSANKSGEYFGYARMISPINDEPFPAIDFVPKAPTSEYEEVPKIIPVPASEFIPKGRIVDDSARGTIFWEEDEEEIEVDSEEKDCNRSISDEPSTSPRAWGNPFEVEWISTIRLPFYRTKGLRNSWNSNREVKIARDGTELETAVGKKLIELFHRYSSPVITGTMGPNMSVMSLSPNRGYQQIH